MNPDKFIKKRQPIKCEYCKKHFYCYPYEQSRRFCSRECYNKSYIIKKEKSDTLKSYNKRRIIVKNKPQSFYKGLKNHRGKTYKEIYGKNAEKECKKRSDSHKKRWKGKRKCDERPYQGCSFEYIEWRKKVFARDNWTCQKTGQRGGDLQAHHIENFSSNEKSRYKVSNGITFSKESHKEFHKIYGQKNNTLDQILEFIKEVSKK